MLFRSANTALQNTTVTLAGDLTITGNTTIRKKTVVNYTPGTADNAAVYIASANTQGGTGYADFLKVSNIAGGTNPNKTFRLNSTGGIEVINSAYSANLFTIDDSGRVIKPYQPVFLVIGSGAGIALNTSAANAWPTVAQSINTNSCFNTSTYRFTPNVAGYYFIQSCCYMQFSGTAQVLLALRKNGSDYKYANYSLSPSTGGDTSSLTSTMMYLNGTTDYASVAIYQNSGSTKYVYGSVNHSYFSGCLIKAE